MEQYFWEVSVAGWSAAAIAYAIMKEGERKAAARRRAQVHRVAVALDGVRGSFVELGAAAGKAAQSFERFSEAFRGPEKRP